MGGRGAASGTSVKGIKYGNEYVSIVLAGNMKFVRRKQEPANVPLETMAADQNRVYVLINKDGVMKSITFYDKSGKRKRQIDLTHTHNGENPHVHIGYEHMETAPLTKSDKAYIAKAKRIWEAVK
jgi:hypothetical protein